MIYGNSSFLELEGQRFLRQGSLFVELARVLERKLSIQDLTMQDYRKINLSFADFHDALSDACDNLHEQAWNQALENFGPYVKRNDDNEKQMQNNLKVLAQEIWLKQLLNYLKPT